MKPYDKFAYRIFGKFGKKLSESNPDIDRLLISANIPTIPEVFMSAKLLTAAISGGVLFVVTILSYILLSALANTATASMATLLSILSLIISITMGIFTILVPILIVYTAVPMLNGKVKRRGKSIDKVLPYAVNYMAALSSAEVSPAFIFRGLAGQEIYGEIKYEAMNIVKDMDVLGMDILTAIHNAIDRSPSMKFQDFLQGVVTTVTSGGSLNIYFQAKSDQYRKENRVEQKGTLETLAVMGESFVTVVVAMPLFLIIIMSVMAMMGGSGGEMFILYVIIGFMIPASQGMFVYVIAGINL